MLPEEKIIEAYNAFGREIFTYLSRLLGGSDAAEDLLHDCFVNLMDYSSKHEVRPDTLRAFLYRTAHNLAINHMKKHANRECTGLEQQVHASSCEFPGEELERRELAEAINRALSKLDTTTRSLFTMRRELSMELADIAGVIGISEKTVRRKLARAMDFLMRELKKGGFAP
jgi:RNA polymerase sigma-70 factor (ECF subfamily)